MQVLPGWIDYNGHMTESRYYFANSETVDAFLRLIGAGMEYVAAGHSFYSAETHIRHLGEARLGDRLTGTPAARAPRRRGACPALFHGLTCQPRRVRSA